MGTGQWDASGTAPICPAPIPTQAPPGGCCKWGAHCAGCDEKVQGWCHSSASACVECTGQWDASGTAPICPAPTPTPAPPGGCCKWGAHCAGCDEKVQGWCHSSASACRECTGQWD